MNHYNEIDRILSMAAWTIKKNYMRKFPASAYFFHYEMRPNLNLILMTLAAGDMQGKPIDISILPLAQYMKAEEDAVREWAINHNL